jgi:GH24 family phage-related lysozyme (muramidase)
MSYDKAAELIKRHEGLSDHIYIDTVGVPTGGYGHAFLEGSNLPIYVAERLFYHDFKAAIDDYNLFNFELDAVRRSVILNMLFNLGRYRFSKFKKLIKALYARQYHKAASEMVFSKWYGQTGNRAKELSEMMETGEYIE